MDKFYLMEYLTGLTDPQRTTEEQIADKGYKLTKTYNYEGVGFIYEYSR